MKRILTLLIALTLGSGFHQKTAASPPPPPSIGIGVHFGFFYSSLRSHGEWIETEPGFHVWRPFHVSHQWRPYLLGRWAWTDYGWYWVSSEPFGWITYHYGRWYFDDYYGWIWIPDDVWGPAWVEWRYDNNYIGWAPLPPYATFSFSMGIYFSTHWVAPVHYWNFVRYHRFGSDIHVRDIAPIEHTRRLIRTTRSGPQYQVDHDRIINRGVDRTVVEQRGRIRISRADVQEVRERSGERVIRSDGNRRAERIEIHRPSRSEMQQNPDRIESQRGKRALSIDMNKIERRRFESRSPSEDQSRRQDVQQDKPRENRAIQRTTPQQEQQREYKPRIQQSKPRQERKDLRRDLIQRYERKQNPAPPVNRQSPRQRIESKRESTPSSQPNRSTQERRSGRGSERQRRD